MDRIRGEGKEVFGVLAGSSLFFLVLFVSFLFGGGLPALCRLPLSEFLFGLRWAPEETPASYSILPMIAGTGLVTGGAVLLAAPLGILAAVYIKEYCSPRFAELYRGMLAVLAGIPSVVYGFFGMLVLVPGIRSWLGGTGNSLLAAILLLAFMLLPTVTEISGSALAEVPAEWPLGARALGAGKIRAIFFVELPAAAKGLRTGVLLAVSRAMGETMAVSMVAGNQARLPGGLLDGVRTLTSGIAMEMGYAAGLHRQVLYAMGMVLLGFMILAGLLHGRED